MRPLSASTRRQRGLTLVELLVAIVLIFMVTLATVALYTVNSSSKRTIDASQSLDDTARFVFELVGQGVHNAGYLGAVPVESEQGATRYTLANLFDACEASAGTTPCPVLGFDNSSPSVGSLNVVSAGSGGVNASDSVAFRFNGVGRRDGTTADGSVQNCSGTAVPVATVDAELGLSVFSVKTLAGEPELYCTWGNGTKNEPIARGVESFQVMYAVDCRGTPCVRDGVPDRWVSAAGVGVANWRHVKAIRIGLILRGPPGSAQAASGDKLYPLGKDFTGDLSETGLVFTPPADGRLRRAYTTTFLLRNSV